MIRGRVLIVNRGLALLRTSVYEVAHVDGPAVDQPPHRVADPVGWMFWSGPGCIHEERALTSSVLLPGEVGIL